MDPEAFELVLSRRPEQAPEYADDVVQRIQEDHLAYHARLRETGQAVTNGPVVGQPDPPLRGLTSCRTGSLEQSRQPAEADPAVRAGRPTVEIMTWYCPPDDLIGSGPVARRHAGAVLSHLAGEPGLRGGSLPRWMCPLAPGGSAIEDSGRGRAPMPPGSQRDRVIS